MRFSSRTIFVFAVSSVSPAFRHELQVELHVLQPASARLGDGEAERQLLLGWACGTSASAKNVE